MDELKRIKDAYKNLLEARKIKCTCSGTVLQYEGGCCCDNRKVMFEAEAKLWGELEISLHTEQIPDQP